MSDAWIHMCFLPSFATLPSWRAVLAAASLDSGRLFAQTQLLGLLGLKTEHFTNWNGQISSAKLGMSYPTIGNPRAQFFTAIWRVMTCATHRTVYARFFKRNPFKRPNCCFFGIFVGIFSRWFWAVGSHWFPYSGLTFVTCMDTTSTSHGAARGILRDSRDPGLSHPLKISKTHHENCPKKTCKSPTKNHGSKNGCLWGVWYICEWGLELSQ